MARSLLAVLALVGAIFTVHQTAGAAEPPTPEQRIASLEAALESTAKRIADDTALERRLSALEQKVDELKTLIENQGNAVNSVALQLQNLGKQGPAAASGDPGAKSITALKPVPEPGTSPALEPDTPPAPVPGRLIFDNKTGAMHAVEVNGVTYHAHLGRTMIPVPYGNVTLRYGSQGAVTQFAPGNWHWTGSGWELKLDITY